MNSECVAYKEQVIMNMKMGTFDLILDTERCRCPMCNQLVKPEGCGFNYCLYNFSGVIVDDKGVRQRKLEQKWRDAGNLYKFYDPRGAGSVKWQQLKIYTKFKRGLPGEAGRHCPMCKKLTNEKDAKLKCQHVMHHECFAKLTEDLGETCLLCHF